MRDDTEARAAFTDTGSTKALGCRHCNPCLNCAGRGMTGQFNRTCSTCGGAGTPLATPAPAEQGEVERLRELLSRCSEELRLLRLKDTGVVYDIGLRSDLHAALSRPSSEALPAGYVMVRRDVFEREVEAARTAPSTPGLAVAGALNRLLAASPQAPASDKSGGEDKEVDAYFCGLDAAARLIRCQMLTDDGDIVIDVDEGIVADRPTLVYVAEAIEARAKKSRTPTTSKASIGDKP